MTHQHSSREWPLVEDWLALPVKSRRRLVVTGGGGAGKTAFLREIAARVPGSAFVDCAGLTADEVALRACAAMGVELAPDELLRGRQGLRSALRGDHTLVLANAQWAGRTVTSAAPHVLTSALSLLMLWAPHATIRLVLEWDKGRLGAPHARDVAVPLERGAGEGQGETVAGTRRPEGIGMHPLGILAAAETREVPVEVYRLLHEALGAQSTPPEFSTLAAEKPDAVEIRGDGTDSPALAFLSPGIAHMWRTAFPPDEAAQRRIVAALLGAVSESPPSLPWPENGPLSRYAHIALPAHGALAGSLEEVLSQGAVLAHLHPDAVWDALARAYPDGVPQEGIPADIRALEAQGAWALSQGEWAAWLHHAAVGAGRTEFARQLAASGVGMPWETVWSKWRPYGSFGPVDGEVGRIDEIALVSSSDGNLLLAAREATTDRSADPDHQYVRLTFDPVGGEQRGAPVTVTEPLYESDWVYDDRVPDGSSAVFAERLDGEWDAEREPEFPLPRCPLSVVQGLGIDNTWVLAGEGGVFAVACPAPERPGPGEPAEPAWHAAPLIGPRSKVAAPEPPAEALAAARGEPDSRFWLEETFGTGSCRRHPDGELPEGVSHPATRRFLSEVGLPDVDGFMHLQLHGGLKPLRGEADAQVAGATALFEIGLWMHARLVLDGATGQVLVLGRDATCEPAGETLAQFLAMVRLFDTFRRGFHPSRADRRDAQNVLAHWCRRLDATVDESDTWEAVLGGHPFEDATWELVSKDNRPPL